MNITHKLYSVGVLPELGQHTNVVKRVHFGIEWEEGGLSSSAFVESILDTSSITDFRPLESLTKDDLIAWGIAAQGGQPFLDELAAHHAHQIAYRREQLGVVNYTGHFEFDAHGRPSTSASPVSLPPIFPTPASGRIDSILFDGGAA